MKGQQKSIEQYIEDLKESKMLGKLLLDNADEAHLFYSLEGKLIYVSPAFHKITGYTTQELYEKNFIPYVHPDDQEWTMKLWQGLFQGKYFKDAEYRIVKKDGEVRWCLSSWKIVCDNDGRHIGIQGKQQDITASKEHELHIEEIEQHNRTLLEEASRRQTEDALRKERDKAQRYLDTVEAIMVALDTDGRIKLVNRKGCELLGYVEEELLGRNWFETFLPPEEVDEVKQVFDEIIKGNIGPVEYYENQITTRNGEKRIIAWHNSILRDNDDKITGSLGAGEDITERKQAEEKTLELLQQNRDLTQRLFHIQEQERRHLARELHDENSQWLTALRMHAHLLADHCNHADPKISDSINDIENITSQMQKSIRRIIRELRAVDLKEMGLIDSLNELVSRWQEHYPQTHCALNITGNFDDLNNMLGVTIYRVIQESLTNVTKHAEAENVSIQLSRCIDKTECPDCILLRIQDDGKGIDLEKPTTGFGLAGMRERVLSVNGEFVFNRAPVEGALIEVRLPAELKDRRKDY